MTEPGMPPEDQRLHDGHRDHDRPDGHDASGNGGKTPIVRRIQAELLDRIRSGELAAGTKLASMRKLSDDFGCSLGIVKQAVNTMVAQGHLRSVPRKGVFVASDTPAEREVVLVLPHLEIARLHVGLLGVKQALEGTGHRISIHAGAAPGEASGPLPEYLSSSQVAGVLVMLPGPVEHDTLLPLLVGRGVPTVVVDIACEAGPTDVVSIDPVEAGRRGVRHLLVRGHRRIMLVEAVGDHRLPDEVTSGVEAEVRNVGLDPAETLTRVKVDKRSPTEETTWRRARSAVAEALAGGRIAPTAIVGVGPQITLGAMLAAKDAGMAVPTDCSVVGLLGDSSALQSSDPPVTIFDNPLKHVCERAASRLLERVAGLDIAAEIIRIEPELMERGSVRDLGAGGDTA